MLWKRHPLLALLLATKGGVLLLVALYGVVQTVREWRRRRA